VLHGEVRYMCVYGVDREIPVDYCNTLQYTATHCSTQGREISVHHCNTLQHTAAHCSTLQHTAAHCSTLQHTATHWSGRYQYTTATLCSTLQHIATHCNTLQHNRAGDISSWVCTRDGGTNPSHRQCVAVKCVVLQ